MIEERELCFGVSAREAPSSLDRVWYDFLEFCII